MRRLHGGHRHVVRASMGPRARARGNGPSPRRARARALGFNGATSARSWKSQFDAASYCISGALQWGHGRPLVEIRLTRVRRATGATLQWGHERALVEMWWEGAGPDATTVASMGPRARARGNGARIGGRHAEGPASMGPRARARGNATQPVVWRWKVWLQWGHERALVEIPSSSLPTSTVSALQWGDEGGLVEIQPGSFQVIGRGSASMGPRARARGNVTDTDSGRRLIARFNGATSARSWKCDHPAWSSRQYRASMGPRARARGNQETAPFAGGCRPRFNGATSARSWKLNALMWASTVLSGFNGATSARSWKFKRLCELHGELSCFNGATSARSWKYRHSGAVTGSFTSLQWGHERALVEIYRRTHGPSFLACFNGATSARSWKFLLSSASSSCPTRFNGATSARSWKFPRPRQF